MQRVWPGMDSREATRGLLERAGAAAGPPDRRRARGAAPATPATSRRSIPLTVDGLGPRGGGAHTPSEFVLAPSLRTSAPRWRWRLRPTVLGLGRPASVPLDS